MMSPQFQLDRELSSLIQQAVQDCCLQFLRIPARCHQGRSRAMLFTQWGISATVPLVQNQLDGALSLRLAAETAEGLISAFFGEPVALYSPRMFEAVSEMTNLVYGLCKVALQAKGYNFCLMAPVVCVGPNQVLLMPETFATTTLHFETDFGPFAAEICSIHQIRTNRINAA